MYIKFFGFKEKPFKLVPNPEYLFLSKSHEEALAHLTYAISQGDGFVEILGEVGTGKTTLCRVFLGNLDKSIDAAYIFNPKLDALQLLKAINDEFGINSTPENTKDLIDILNAFLIEKKGAGQKVLVLIDEAQNLSLEVLEQLRLLSNLETTKEKLLQIILVGQPELGDMLSSHQLRQLEQRITINCQLSPLTYEETRDYIRYRIALASHRAGPPFDKKSYHAIYEYSQGIPRLINIACDRVLLNAFSRNSFKITSSITKEAIRELTRKKAGTSGNWFHKHTGLVIVSAIFIPFIILSLYLADREFPKITASSKPVSPEQLTQVKTQQTAPGDKQVSGVSALSEVPVTPQTDESTAIPEENLAPIQPAGFDKNVALMEDSEPLENAPEKTKIPGESLAEYTNKSADASFDFRPAIAEQQAQTNVVVHQSENSGDAQNFLNYLKTLNSRSSRNRSIGKILKLWFPTAEINIKNNRMESDRHFFQVAVKQYDLQAQPLATEIDLDLIQSMNLPAVFTFYLEGHSWPQYLAVAYIDTGNIYYIAGEQGQIASVDREIFLQYWSGEAYIFWKNFKNLNGVVTQQSKGQDVITLKKILQQLGYSNISMTDTYDNDTMQIIKTIQAAYNLHIDGIVGPFTKIALYNENSEFIKPSLIKFEAAKTENGS
jgi:general secretion pathway protein A